VGLRPLVPLVTLIAALLRLALDSMAFTGFPADWFRPGPGTRYSSVNELPGRGSPLQKLRRGDGSKPRIG
jgi:hypothetical protein